MRRSFAASSNGGRLLFTRNVGNIVMDTDDVEVLTLNALGGTDTVTRNNLDATDVQSVNVNLGVSGAATARRTRSSSTAPSARTPCCCPASAGSVTMTGDDAHVAITNAEAANDTLTLNTSNGDDIVNASGLASTSVDLTINGGAGNDVLVGSQGGDTLNGDADTDYIDGGAGIDAQSGGETVVNVP